MDALTSVTFEIQNVTASSPAAQTTAQASVFEIGHFNQAAENAATQNQAVPTTSEVQPSESFQRAVELLDNLNGGLKNIGLEATAMQANNAELTPSQMLDITVKAHQFLFQSELTANVANRTSEGIQQLFRQQS